MPFLRLSYALNLTYTHKLLILWHKGIAMKRVFAWTVLALLLALAPGYFRNIGICGFWGVTYLLGVFLVGGASSRYFAPIWSVILLAAPVPIDLALRLWRAKQKQEAA